ncbi:IPT/TIG domain-containing protein [Corallococcus sp. M34]|uniref:IPT/TIG domain-containing protein n=1 Tax=Citreicoccus inhibens TaxID=2849499 RepID=UPI001C24474B|nr:IPT/TIG domain-containing protein [Citreicoccus inhibens]MBU8899829.1 IPT/TIG domain-containing protein [Citreicoccus inhibens]
MTDVNLGWNLAIGIDPTLVTTLITQSTAGARPVVVPVNASLLLQLDVASMTPSLDTTAGALVLTLPYALVTTREAVLVSGMMSIGVKLANLGFGCVYRDWFLSTTGTAPSAGAPGGVWALNSYALTLETWVRTESTGPQTLLSMSHEGLSLSLEDNQLVLTWGEQRCVAPGAPAVMSDGSWHHVAVTLDQELVTFFQDGQPKGTARLSSRQQASGADLMFGEDLAGDLALTRIWNVVRAPAQLQQSMNVLVPPQSTPGLVGDWTYANGQFVNLVTGLKGAVKGGAAIRSQASLVPPDETPQAQTYVWLFDPQNTFTVQVTPDSDYADPLEAGVLQYLRQLSISAKQPSQRDLSASMPTTGVFRLTQEPESDLVLFAMAGNLPPPVDPLPMPVQTSVWLATTATQNTSLSIDDTCLLTLMGPVMAKVLHIPESALQVTGSPPVLGLTHSVDGKVNGQDIHLTSFKLSVSNGKGLAMSLKGTSHHLVTQASGTITLELRKKDGVESLYYDIDNPKVSLTPDQDDPLVVSYEASLALGTLLSLVTGLIGAIFMGVVAWKQSQALQKMRDKQGFPKDAPAFQDLTLQGVDFVTGLVLQGQYAPAAPPPPSTVKSLSSSAAPVITDIAPTGGAPGTMVTVTGSGFTGVKAVRIAGARASYFRCWADNRIVARVADTATTGPVEVTTPAGTATSTTAFTVTPPPTLSAISQGSGTMGQKVVLRGSNLAGATVSFSENLLSACVANDTQVSTQVPSGAVSGPITVVTPSGKATWDAFTVMSNVTPVVTALDPPAGPEGTEVTLTGTGFTGTTAVSFQDVPAMAFTVLSDTSLVASVGLRTTSGPVRVTNTHGSGASPQPFSVTPAPALTDFSPKQGVAGTRVTVTGHGLLSATNVYIGAPGVSVPFTVSSDTQLTATSPGGTTSGPISADVSSGRVKTDMSFTVLSDAAPRIDGFSPASGGRGTAVTLTGAGFTGTTKVSFGNTPAASFEVSSDAQLIAYVPNNAPSGVLHVSNSRDSARSLESFQYVTPPSISRIKPTTGKAGDTITLDGTGLASATRVRFGQLSTAEAAIQVKGAGDQAPLVVTVPPGAVTGNILVDTPSGKARSSDTFEVKPQRAPEVTGFSPNSGGAGTQLTLQGSGFTGTTAVSVGKVSVARYEVHSDTELMAVLSSATVTDALVVTNSLGAGHSKQVFTVPLSVTGFSPGHGVAGTAIQLTGCGFTQVQRVSFGDSAMRASFSVQSDTKLTAYVPAGAVSGLLQVATNDLAVVTSDTFAVESSAKPVIQSLSPTSGPAGTLVTVEGSGFTGVTGVSVDTQPATHVQVLSDTRLTFTVPQGARSGAVQVKNTLGTDTSRTNFIVPTEPATPRALAS